VTDEQLRDLVPEDAASLAEFRRVIGGGLEAILHTSMPAPGDVEAERRGETTFDGQKVEKLVLRRKGSGEAVPAIFIKPRGWNGVVIVAVSPADKRRLFEPLVPPHERLNPLAQRLLERGAAVLAPDVLLTGEYGGDDPYPAPQDARRHGSYVGYTWGYNRTLIGNRVHDLLTAVAFAGSLDGIEAVRLAGAERAAVWVALASALAGGGVERTVVALGEAPPAFSASLGVDDPDFLPGALRYGGLPYFLALCAPRELRVVLPPEADLDAVVRAAYEAAGARQALARVEHGEDLLEWIAGSP